MCSVAESLSVRFILKNTLIHSKLTGIFPAIKMSHNLGPSYLRDMAIAVT